MSDTVKILSLTGAVLLEVHGADLQHADLQHAVGCAFDQYDESAKAEQRIADAKEGFSDE